MDRETELINAIKEILTIISGLQDSVANLTAAGKIMRERIETLERQAKQ